MATGSTSPSGSPRTRGVVIASLVAVVLAVCAYAWARGKNPPASAGHYPVLMTDYAFTLSHMTWHVGERVTLILINELDAHLRKSHEFMLGRGPRREETVFGETQETVFDTPFFDSMVLRLDNGKRLTMLMPGGAHFTGADPKSLMAPMKMDGMDHGAARAVGVREAVGDSAGSERNRRSLVVAFRLSREHRPNAKGKHARQNPTFGADCMAALSSNSSRTASFA